MAEKVIIRAPGAQGIPGPVGQLGPVTAWQANTHYSVDQPVTHPTGAEEMYRCIADHTSGSSFDPSKWQKVAARGSAGAPGNAGDSAYDIAVDNGFVGTEAQWLASLRGPASTVPGPSAYAVAVANGFIGTQSDWLTSLHGAPGSPGSPGTNGRTIWPTTGAPSNTVGLDGDLAYDKDNGPTIYGPKAGGVWPAGIVLRGAQGLPGAAGDSNKSLLGGRVMAQAVGITTGGNIAANNMPHYTRTKVKILRGIASPRIIFVGPLLQEVAGANPVIIKASIEPLNPDGSGGGTRFPIFFNGQRETLVEPDALAIIPDPIGALDLFPSDLAWVHAYQRPPFGPATTLASPGTIGDTTILLTALPKATGLVTVNLGGSSEVVQIDSYTGSGPYTATLKSGTALTKNHASGVTVGQQGWHTRTTFSDLGEISTQSNTDLTDSGTASQVGVQTTTLSADANVGAAELLVPLAIQGTQLTIGAEALSVKQILGTSAPYRVQLNGTVGTFHASGSTVTSNIGAGQGLAPLAVVGDHIFGTASPAVLGIGDSIMEGVGDTERQRSSWFTRAFAGNRPYINIAKSGESLNQFKVLSASKRRRMLLDCAEWIIIGYGVNDLYTGQSAAQLETDLLNLIAQAYRRVPKVALTTLLPRTQLTAGHTDWDDLVNQNITLPSGAGAQRDIHNTWVRTAKANGYVTEIIDIAAAVESPTAPGKWDIDALGPLTIDGIHPSTLGHKRIKNAVNLALFV